MAVANYNAEMFYQGLDKNRECECTKYEENADVIQQVLGYRYGRDDKRHYSCAGDGLIFPARDKKTSRKVIIKIAPTTEYRDHAPRATENTDYSLDFIEIARLKAIGDFRGRGKMFCCLLEDYMYVGWHVGMVFPQYGPDLYELTSQHGQLPLLWDNLVAVAFQVIQAIKFLHDNGLAHLDIKPENIVAVCSEYQEIALENTCCRNREYTSQIFLEMKDPRIKIVDFGSSEFFSGTDSVALRCNTQMFRAPEMILQLDCGSQCDKWSIGCTLMELYYGGAFFPCTNDIIHLAAIHKAIGPIPYRMISEAEIRETYFPRGLSRAIKENLNQDIIKNIRPLEDMMIFGPDEVAKMEFRKLLRGLMAVDPSKRIEFTHALQLPYFDGVPGYIKIQ